MRRWLVVALAALLTACASRSTAELRIAGSTSVQPLAEVLAEAYSDGGGARISIQGGGSTAGVQAVLSGVADMGAISRDLTPEEKQQGLVAHVIAYDVLALVVHPTNPLSAISMEQLGRMFSGNVSDWREVGGKPGPIHLISREAGSGSREAFRSLVGPISPRSIVQNSSGAIRVAVVDNPQAIGYVSLGVAQMGGVKTLALNGTLPGDRRYPLVRSLSLVTKGQPTGAALAFIRFVRSPAGRRLVTEEGLVPVR